MNMDRDDDLHDCIHKFSSNESQVHQYAERKNGQYIRLAYFVSADGHIPVLDPLAALILASRTWSNPQV